MKGTLYLIPTPLGEQMLHPLPEQVKAITRSLDVFIVERAKTARHFLKLLDMPTRFDDMTFFELNKHTLPEDLESFLSPALAGKSIGLMSEAGVPSVADPGAEIVSIAHRKGIRVVPLTGPSSILLSLMASGLGGQNFAFLGYLPLKKPERVREIKREEQHGLKNRQTKIFIETPYRNMALLEDLLQTLSPDTVLCVAVDLTLPSEIVIAKPVKAWKKMKRPDLAKKPAVFLFGRAVSRHYRKEKY